MATIVPPLPATSANASRPIESDGPVFQPDVDVIATCAAPTAPLESVAVSRAVKEPFAYVWETCGPGDETTGLESPKSRLTVIGSPFASDALTSNKTSRGATPDAGFAASETCGG